MPERLDGPRELLALAHGGFHLLRERGRREVVGERSGTSGRRVRFPARDGRRREEGRTCFRAARHDEWCAANASAWCSVPGMHAASQASAARSMCESASSLREPTAMRWNVVPSACSTLSSSARLRCSALSVLISASGTRSARRRRKCGRGKFPLGTPSRAPLSLRACPPRCEEGGGPMDK